MSQTYRVLMADDSAFAHTVVAKYLAGTEFQIVGDAKTDVEAVALFKQLKPDLVLLDVIMPEKGGIDALRSIMAADPATKALMLSSLGTEDTVTECLAVGARTFVQKPFDKDTLLAQLRAAVNTEGT